MRRRSVLAGGGVLCVAFLSGCALPVIPKRPAPVVADAMGWIRHDNGRFVLYLPRVEMGQNIATALKQIACEELGIEWAQLELRLPDTRDIGRVRATVGSESIKDFALPLAQACAALRNAILTGKTQANLGVEAQNLKPLRVLAPGGRFVGATPQIEHGDAIARGQTLYVADTRRPGMVFGRVLRAPASPELDARALAMEQAAARAVPGFVAIVQDDLLALGRSRGIGIVARTPGALDRIESALATRWQVDGSFEQADIDLAVDIDRRLATGALANRIHGDAIDRTSKWDVDLRFDIPLAAHAPIEPRAAVAEFDAAGELELWVGSQDVFYQRDVVAKRLGLAHERVTVHGCRVGGAFGGKTICTVELEAAVLARAVQLPVKVQWTRAQEFRLGFHRPPSSHRIRVRLRGGRLDQWWHAFSSSHILFTNAVVPAWLQRITDVIGDDGVARGAALSYRAATRRTEFDLVRLPVLTGPWRGLGAGPNLLAIECAISECARVAGADAVQFRLDHIDDPRLARVLRQVAQAARWNAPSPPPKVGHLRGRGVACGIYKSMSYAAVVADVEVEIASGAVKVHHMWCAHDCGRVINPDQVRAQCEGNLVWGLGMVLSDRLPVSTGQVAATTFADAPIPRLGDLPSMEILLVDEGEAPSGAGETAIVASGAAIATAVRAATGVLPGRFPVAASDLQTALRRVV